MILIALASVAIVVLVLYFRVHIEIHVYKGKRDRAPAKTPRLETAPAKRPRVDGITDGQRVNRPRPAGNLRQDSPAGSEIAEDLASALEHLGCRAKKARQVALRVIEQHPAASFEQRLLAAIKEAA